MVKVLVYYNGTKPFGIEVCHKEALQILNAYLNQDVDMIEIEGYGVYPKEATKIEFFDTSKQ